MIDPKKVCLYIPNGLSSFKQKLFDRIAEKVGITSRGNVETVAKLPDDILPLVGCSPELTDTIASWRKRGRRWAYWDRGYFLRVFATHTPRGENGGMYRFHLDGFQLQKLKDVPADRWRSDLEKIRKAGGVWASMSTDGLPWKRGGRHIVIAAPTRTYCRFHRCESWIADTIDALARVTDRQLVIRDKESKRPLQSDLDGAHCLVTHASIAAVESIILGCPVFVHPDSAAALVGETDLKKIEYPVYPDREPWLSSLAYSQFSESELLDGTLWRLLA